MEKAVDALVYFLGGIGVSAAFFSWVILKKLARIEKRVTQEESRNTDIEDLARAHKAGTESHPSWIHQDEERGR